MTMNYITSTKTTYSKVNGMLMLLPIIKLNNHVQVTCDINENQYKRLERMGIKTGDIIEQGNNSYKVSSLVKYMLFLEIASN